MKVHNEHGLLRKVIMCQPLNFSLQPINVIAQSFIEQDQHPQRESVMREHTALCAAYRDAGVEVELLTPDSRLPYQVFTRDLGVMTPDGMLVGRFREPCRRGEVDSLLAQSSVLVWRGPPPDGAYLEGGDLMYLDNRRMAVGIGSRTNRAGAEWACEQLAALDIEGTIVEFDQRYLHLDMIFNVVGERVAVAHPGALPVQFLSQLNQLGFTLIEVDDETVFGLGANLMALGSDFILSPVANQQVNARLKAFGFKLLEVELQDLLRGGGGPHCMTFPLVREF